MIVRLGKDEHVTHVLHDLHWLPIKMRVHFKVLLYTYKGLNDHAPSYICDMIEMYEPGKPLRSDSQEWIENLHFQTEVEVDFSSFFFVLCVSYYNAAHISIKSFQYMCIFAF